jgi:hypothetical protein
MSILTGKHTNNEQYYWWARGAPQLLVTTAVRLAENSFGQIWADREQIFVLIPMLILRVLAFLAVPIVHALYIIRRNWRKSVGTNVKILKNTYYRFWIIRTLCLIFCFDISSFFFLMNKPTGALLWTATHPFVFLLLRWPF